MHHKAGDESRAIHRLISEIDSIDQWRDRIPRRIVALFFGVFVVAVTLLFYVATHSVQRVDPPGMGKPVPGVLRSLR